MNLISAYNWLTIDTESFKGNPRTCDLYNYESFIYATIKKPLKHIKSKGTCTSELDEMSNETSTVLQGSTGGPLPTFRFLNLLMEIANVENNEVVLGIISEKITKENNYRLYTYLADYSFKHAIILAKANKYELSKMEFKQGVLYLLSYSSRKDRTLSHLFDSVLTTFEIDNVVGRRNVERLKPLADAVVYHTDGKSTKTYQREWFELLISTNIELAITYLRKELVQRVNHWIVEDSLEELLIRCNSSIYPQIENSLLKTFSTNSSQNFIEAFVRNIEWLLENKITATAKRSLMELASRIDSEDRMELLNIDLINTLQKLYKYFGVEWNNKIHLKKKNSVYTSRNYQKSLVNRKGFVALSYGEFLEYINNYGIRNEDIQGVYYYLSLKLQGGLDEENKNFIRGLVNTCFEKRSINLSNNRLLEIIDNLGLSNDIMAYFYMQIFLEYTDGWYHRFTELSFFKQAHEYDTCVAEDAFFNYIYNHLNTADYSFAVGGQIINSLAAINYDDQLVLEYWDKLFDIIDFRLSEQIDYDWEPIKAQAENFEIEEKMISLLLTRLKYGEANRFKWVKCELNYLLEDKIFREKFSKPFIQFHEEKDEYIDYALIFLLVLVKNHYKFNELVENKMSYALEKIYPTSDALTNYLIRSVIHKSDVKIYCQYNRKHQIYNESC